jgi:hypothetical protein
LRQRVVGNQVIERADDVRDGLHAVIEQNRTGLSVDEGLEPLERIVVEVVILLQDTPRHTRSLQRLCHGLPLETLVLVVVQVAERGLRGVERRCDVAIAVPAAEQELPVGICGRLRALKVLVADTPRVGHRIIERQIGSVEVRHAEARFSGSVPPVEPAAVDDADVAGISHFGGGHAGCRGLVEGEVEWQEVLVDGMEMAVERLLEGRRAVFEGGGSAVVEAADLGRVTTGSLKSKRRAK